MRLSPAYGVISQNYNERQGGVFGSDSGIPHYSSYLKEHPGMVENFDDHPAWVQVGVTVHDLWQING